MDDCVFCKIIKKELPSNQVYETENTLAFLTIGPISEGHTLIIPKKHVVWIQDADDEILVEIFKVAKKLIHSLKKGFNCDYVQVSVTGTDVPHLHVHLIPRYHNDGLIKWTEKKYKEGEPNEIAKKIIAAL